jgi:hypothetical protein
MVTVTIHDGSPDSLSGATVSGNWSGGFSVTFTITGVTHASLTTYDAQANHDPDGDSEGTSVTVIRP